MNEAAAGLPWPVRLAGETAAPYGKDVPLSNVERLGVQSGEQVAALMAQAAIFAHPARYEPFGLSVLEAALAGCALVLGDIDTLRENSSGRRASSRQTIRRRSATRSASLVANESNRHALGAAARRRAELFSPAVHRDAYYQVYQDMMRGARGRRPIRAAGRLRPTVPRG